MTDNGLFDKSFRHASGASDNAVFNGSRSLPASTPQAFSLASSRFAPRVLAARPSAALRLDTFSEAPCQVAGRSLRSVVIAVSISRSWYCFCISK